MWKHTGGGMSGLGEGGSEGPTSHLLDLRSFSSPTVVVLTICLFSNFPRAHNLCCLVSASLYLMNQFAYLGEGIWTYAACYACALFRLSAGSSFSISLWSKRDMKGSKEKSCGWEWGKEEEAQMVPRDWDDWIMLQALHRGDWLF